MVVQNGDLPWYNPLKNQEKEINHYNINFNLIINFPVLVVKHEFFFGGEFQTETCLKKQQHRKLTFVQAYA